MKFQLENGFLAYDYVGDGVPLLFIHGYPLSRRIWNPQIKELIKFISLISVDLRGHGESYPFMGPYSMDLLAEDCKRLLDHLAVKTPIFVCGLSMGGYVTFALFRKYPYLFKGMILTATRPGADSPGGKANREASIQIVQDQGVAKIADNMLPKLVSPISLSMKSDLIDVIRDIMLQTSVNGVIGALQGMKDREDSIPLLSHIKCPTLIIHGADDQTIPIREAELMNQQISNSRFVAIPEAGHLLNMEQPERFNLELQEFIKYFS